MKSLITVAAVPYENIAVVNFTCTVYQSFLLFSFL